MIAFMTGILAFVSDHISKRWAETHLDEKGTTRPLLGGRIVLRRLSNKGLAGGFFAKKKALVTAGSVVGVMGVAAFCVKLAVEKGSALTRAGLALIVGGGAGNLRDRLKSGAVTDFISFRHRGKTGKLVYNLADFAIFGGILLTLIGEMTGSKK